MKKGIGVILLITFILLFTLSTAAEPAGSAVIDINSVKIEINGQKTDLGTILFDGLTYVPLRAISEKFGKEVSWNPNTGTAKINDGQKQPVSSQSTAGMDEKTGTGKSIAFLLSAALLLAGAILLTQIIFIRTKKDISIILKTSPSSSISTLGLKRLIYTSWVSKIGFIYLICGFLLRLYGTDTSMHAAINILSIVLILTILWFAGLWISKIMSYNEYIQDYDIIDNSDTYKSNSYSIFDK